MTPEAARRRLADLGARRRAHDEAGAALAKEIRRALVATDGVIPLTEAAELLDIHRTTLYRVYRPG